MNTKNKYTQMSLTKQIKDRDNEISVFIEKIKAIENFKTEKENLLKNFTS